MVNRNRNVGKQEEVSLQINLLFPIVIFVLLLVIESVGLIVLIATMYGMPAILAAMLFVIFILIGLTIAEYALYSSSKCYVTNHRLVGVVKSLFYRRTFSYQLDHIVGIQIKNIFGFKHIDIKVSHGNGDSEKVKLLFVRNGNDVYFSLAKMIDNAKTDVDCLLESLDNNKE